MNTVRCTRGQWVRIAGATAAVVALVILAAAAAPSPPPRAFALDVLARYAPDGRAIIARYESTPWAYRLSDRSISMSPTDFMDFVQARGPVDIVAALPTAVHETCHSYSRKLTWQVLCETHQPWRESLALPMGPGTELLVPLTPVFPSAAIAPRIDVSLREARYRTYIATDNANQTTQSKGIYGLLDELNAYRWGTRTAIDLLAWHQREGPRTRQSWTKGLQAVEGVYPARAQMTLFILTWLLEARIHHPIAYRAFIENTAAVKAFVTIDDVFARDIERYARVKAEILRETGMRETSDCIEMGGGFAIGTGTVEYARFNRALATPEIKAIDALLRARTSGADTAR
jgi:hypothetical protein